MTCKHCYDAGYKKGLEDAKPSPDLLAEAVTILKEWRDYRVEIIAGRKDTVQMMDVIEKRDEFLAKLEKSE